MNFFSCPKPELFPELVPATVEEAIAPNQRGRVKCQGTFWPAKFYQNNCQKTIPPGEPVTVIGIEGITLLVVL